MAVKLLIDHILLSKVYSFEGFSNWHKNAGIVNNYSKAVTSSDFKKSANTTKHC